MDDPHINLPNVDITRRTVIETGTTALLLSSLPRGALAAEADRAEPSSNSIELRVNGHLHDLTLDPRTTLLDALREHQTGEGRSDVEAFLL
jgi:xanthine dehydrogenase YagT iron-sulfur-binding subunit